MGRGPAPQRVFCRALRPCCRRPVVGASHPPRTLCCGYQRGRGRQMTQSPKDNPPETWFGQSLWSGTDLAQQEFPSGLYVVATPLGIAADVTLRALWVLRLVDCVAAEDTRTTAPLLARYGIAARLLALHQHNEAQASAQIMQRLTQGQRVALVSDAGTPAISDPGALVVRAALDAGVRVLPVPGASSLTAALSVAGVGAGPVRFVGFVPARAAARRRLIHMLADDDAATVLFEAPHRVLATSRELATALDPTRRIVVMRELTKRFESVVPTTAAALPTLLERSPPRGEYVLVIDAPEAARTPLEAQGSPDSQIDAVTARWLAALREELPASRAAAIAAKASGLPRAILYGALAANREHA